MKYFDRTVNDLLVQLNGGNVYFSSSAIPPFAKPPPPDKKNKHKHSI